MEREQDTLEGVVEDIIYKNDENGYTVARVELDDGGAITIVGATETEPPKLKISSDSPIGAALLGSKVGDVVSVDVPMGVMKMNVLEISR